MTRLFTPVGKVVESPSTLLLCSRRAQNSSTDHIGSNAIGGRGTYLVALVAFLFTFSFLVSSSYFLDFSFLLLPSCIFTFFRCFMLLTSIAVCFVGLAPVSQKKKKRTKKQKQKSLTIPLFVHRNGTTAACCFLRLRRGEGWSVVIDCDGFFSIIRRFHSDGGLDQRRLEVWSGPCLFEKGRCGTI